MKKSVILLSLLILFIYSCDFKKLDDDNPVNPTDNSIVVVSPNGGDSLMVGESYTIKWTSDITDQVVIQYSVDNGNNWITIADSLANSGSYEWTPIPNKLSSNIKIKVSNLDGSVFDVSNNTFRIIENTNSIIILTSPTGGESLNLGSSTTITWVSSKIDYIKLEFSADNGESWNVITNRFSAGTSQYVWDPIPSVYSTECLIKISMAEDGSIYDQSGSNFSILVAEGINMLVLSPNGGESWNGGSHQEIKWFSREVEKVNIEYTNNNGVNWQTIASAVQNTGIYYWNPIPNIPSTLSRVRISNANDNSEIDESDAVFAVAPEPQINVLAPNGGESLQAGTSNNITWTSTNIADVKLEYTTNNGAQWFTIIDSTESDGNFSWENIPDVNSSLCRIRVSDVKDGEPIDISDENFTIFNQITQLINIVSPNGGEEWQAATSQNITWESTGIDSVKIEYTTNNGIDWVLLEEKTASSGSYEWNTPDVKSTQVKIRISDANDELPADESDGTFTLTQAGSITLLSPKSGEVWQAGQEYEIKWESENVENVLIEYTSINGKYEPESPAPWEDDYLEIVKSTPAGTGSYKVVFTDPSNEYKIRVGDAEFGSPADFSGLFTVSPQPFDSIEVTSPNGGEDWLTGETYEIRWISFNIEKVNIHYTLDNHNWISIANTISSNGLYNWNIPSTVDFRSDICKIRITNAQDTAKYDVSDEFFSIHPQEKLLRLISPNGTEGEELPNYIRWESAGITHVKLEYTVNNGINWVQIVDNLPSNGLYEWDLPQVPSSLCRVRVTDASADAGQVPMRDESDSFFSINGGSTLTLLSPNGGDNLQSGSSFEITWTSQNIEQVKIEYTLTNGPNWTTLVDSTTSDGSFNWDPIPNSQSKLCKIRISNARDKNHFDISDASFEITNNVVTNKSIQLTAPNGGEIFTEGTREPITWISENVEFVKIEFSSNNGGSWEILVNSTPSDGSWTWDPVSDRISDLCAIKVSDITNEVKDISDGLFTIEEQIDQISGEPASIFLVSQSLDAIGVTESGSPETAQITFEVQDSSGIPIDIAHAVDVNFRFGAHPDGGEIIAPKTVRTDHNGQVKVNLTSGTIAGAVQVIGEITFNGEIIRSKPVHIAIHGGLPEDSHFSVGSGQLNYPHLHKIAAEGEITALVGDRYSNPVRPGTAVYYSTDAGVIEGSNLTDEFGRASVTILSGDPQPNHATYGPGFFNVYANTIDENDQQISTSTLVLYSGYPQITISEQTFAIANGGSQYFTYTVMDENGNPLAPGNKYTVSVTTDGDAGVSGATGLTMPDTQFGNTTFSFRLYDSKDDEYKPADAIITISVNGPNGIRELSISGTIE
ncbi:MAG: hypothetical protein JEY94_13275 [Melioribacteraceae bacterium]|nr:hypothetical protein [Melioribacteraceae bacterium]